MRIICFSTYVESGKRISIRTSVHLAKMWKPNLRVWPCWASKYVVSSTQAVEQGDLFVGPRVGKQSHGITGAPLHMMLKFQQPNELSLSLQLNFWRRHSVWGHICIFFSLGCLYFQLHLFSYAYEYRRISIVQRQWSSCLGLGLLYSLTLTHAQTKANLLRRMEWVLGVTGKEGTKAGILGVRQS